MALFDVIFLPITLSVFKVKTLQMNKIMIGEIANSFLKWLILKLNVSAFSVLSYERNTK